MSSRQSPRRMLRNSTGYAIAARNTGRLLATRTVRFDCRRESQLGILQPARVSILVGRAKSARRGLWGEFDQPHPGSATERNIENCRQPGAQVSRRTNLAGQDSRRHRQFQRQHLLRLHLMGISIWFLIDTGHFFGLRRFDPFPFILPNMVVSVEAVLLSTFVLMKQNRMPNMPSNATT